MKIVSGIRFKIKDSNYFLLPNNRHMLHLCSISYGMREFVLMIQIETHQAYIEEVVLTSSSNTEDVWANFKFIEDNSLMEDLANFCQEQKLLDVEKIALYILNHVR